MLYGRDRESEKNMKNQNVWPVVVIIVVRLLLLVAGSGVRGVIS